MAIPIQFLVFLISLCVGLGLTWLYIIAKRRQKQAQARKGQKAVASQNRRREGDSIEVKNQAERKRIKIEEQGKIADLNQPAFPVIESKQSQLVKTSLEKQLSIEKAHRDRAALDEQAHQKRIAAEQAAAARNRAAQLEAEELRKKWDSQQAAAKLRQKEDERQALEAEEARIRHEREVERANQLRIERQRQLAAKKLAEESARKQEEQRATSEAKAQEEEVKRKQKAADTSKLLAKKQAEEAKLLAEQLQAAQNSKPVIVDWHVPQALSLCEVGTSYATHFESRFGLNPANFSFNSIKSQSSHRGDSVHNALNSGVKQIDTEQELVHYIFAFGNMHRAKLNEAFSAFASSENLQLEGKQIEVFDYGCGQGIATVLLLDYLRANDNLNCTLAQSVLIEPSALALERAALHVRHSVASVNLIAPIAAYQIELDQLGPNHLRCHENSVKFHLFSNILDVESIDLAILQNKILNSISGVNYFVCVSPNLWPSGVGTHPRNKRLHDFYMFFQSNCDTTLIANRTNSITSGGKNWHRFERVFRVNASSLKAAAPRQQPVCGDNDLTFRF